MLTTGDVKNIIAGFFDFINNILTSQVRPVQATQHRPAEKNTVIFFAKLPGVDLAAASDEGGVATAQRCRPKAEIAVEIGLIAQAPRLIQAI